MLKIENLSVHYGAALALDRVDLAVERGETVALVGANGAGKTTLLKAVMGLLRPSSGSILFQGEELRGLSPARIVAKGVALSPEGRELFPDLTVAENLRLGAVALRLGRAEEQRRLAEAVERFPLLSDKLGRLAGTLSGGEQQMAAMARALMAKPQLLLLDEPSLGLSPLITDQLFDIIRQLGRSGTTILLVEQNAARALAASRRTFLLANGRMVDSGQSWRLLNDPQLRRAFLGAGMENRAEGSRLGAVGLTNIRLEKIPMNQQQFLPTFRDEQELADHQLRGLQWTVRHAFEGSAFYRERLEQAGIAPGAITSLADVVKLPFTTAEDLREGYPFPLRAVPFEQIVRIHASSGTTGKRKVLCYTQKDVDDWTHFFARAYAMAGVTTLDRVQVAVGYGVWTA
ncbi:MAG: ATP-binding cassette domain-containing protein, partial [Deltaproteobacteria bacterium]|nr:ATP-binding cassette domain-containing protein [Deltaproteobacteria bacterium]